MRRIQLFLLFLCFSTLCMAQDSLKLFYFADPMCSWCYGFSPELTTVVDSLDENIEFQIVMGGLRPYNQQPMPELANFLKEHWDHVAEASGQSFSYSILKDSSIVYDTEPACRAVAIMRALKPDQAFKYFKAIQTAFYQNNQNPNEADTYASLAVSFGIDKQVFLDAFESENWKKKIREDFEYAANIGVRGFPTLVLQNGKDYYLLTNGYAKASVVLAKINQVLEN